MNKNLCIVFGVALVFIMAVTQAKAIGNIFATNNVSASWLNASIGFCNATYCTTNLWNGGGNLAWGAWFNQTNETYALNATLSRMAWNQTNTSYYLASNPSSYISSVPTTYMLYSSWNSTNSTYDTLTRTAMLYSAWNSTNATYDAYKNATGWFNGMHNGTISSFNTYCNATYCTTNLWNGGGGASGMPYSSWNSTNYTYDQAATAYYNNSLSQTPWKSNINGGNYSLTNVSTINVTNYIEFSDADSNVKLGYQAGKNIVPGAAQNTYTGRYAGLSSSSLSTNAADNNVGTGYESLVSNTIGAQNVGIGAYSLDSNTEGSNNVGIGYSSMPGNTIGNSNIGIGYGSLNTNNGGSNNIAIGIAANYYNNGGSTNTIIGDYALGGGISSSGNIGLGYYAGRYETGSNAFYIDNQDRTNTAGDKGKALLYGTFGTTPLSQNLTVNAILRVGKSDGSGLAYAFPTVDGTNSYILSTNGAGNVSWVANSAGMPYSSWNATNSSYLINNGLNPQANISAISARSLNTTNINVTGNLYVNATGSKSFFNITYYGSACLYWNGTALIGENPCAN